jgi:outer membrane receptor protein involved in Fe transport
MLSFWNRRGSLLNLESARALHAGLGVAPTRPFCCDVGSENDVAFCAVKRPDRSFAASLYKERSVRARSPELWCALGLMFGSLLGTTRAQDAVVPPDTAEIVVSATRLPTPEDEAPASVSVITAQDFEDKQTERVADALRQVPGLSVVQTGSPGQLTSVFTRGLRSEHTQVLIDGVPINQGLAGLFDFADLTIDNIDRIEIVRGPQSTIYGPRALAGVIQIFTKQGNDTPETTASFEGGSFDTSRNARHLRQNRAGRLFLWREPARYR